MGTSPQRRYFRIQERGVNELGYLWQREEHDKTEKTGGKSWNHTELLGNDKTNLQMVE